MFIDTHAHLNDQAYSSDVNEVIKRAYDNNVCYINIIAWDKESSYKAIELCEKYNSDKIHLYPVVGIHPENLKEMNEEDKDLKWLEEL